MSADLTADCRYSAIRIYEAVVSIAPFRTSTLP
jgi:hypothetical protein